MELEVTSSAYAMVLRAAGDAHPKEACGILLGEGYRITAAQTARNVHAAPETHFEIDPQALIDAHRAQRSGGPQVIGYFHSHPNGAARPSPKDQAASARDACVWAIAAGGHVTFWSDDPEGFRQISYRVIEC